MRDPDLTGVLTDDCAAMAWKVVADEAVDRFAKMVGITPRDVELARKEVEQAYRGPDVKAWKLRRASPALVGAMVSAWIVEGPFNVAWDRWTVCAVHLRPQEGVPEPKVVRADATHEVIIVSLDPSGERDIEKIEAGSTLKHLGHADLAHQVVGLTDKQAAELVDLSVQAIVRGEISPDRDYRNRWRSLLDRTAEHLRYGGHPENN